MISRTSPSRGGDPTFSESIWITLPRDVARRVAVLLFAAGVRVLFFVRVARFAVLLVVGCFFAVDFFAGTWITPVRS